MKRIIKSIIKFTTLVIAVHDGDTVSIIHSDNIPDTVRLIGIDAPEIDQSAGLVSRQFLAALILNQTVTIEMTSRDDHGRILGRIIYNGQDVNLTMLKEGWAWSFYPKTVPKQFQNDYQSAFAAAKANQLGIFSDPNVIEPSVWRKTPVK